MLCASTEDEHTLVDVLARAFVDDPVMRWLLPEDYDEHCHDYFKIALAEPIKAGAGFTNEDKTGVALWCRPDDKTSPLTEFIAGLRSMWLLKGNLPRAYELQAVMQHYRPKKDFLHLTHLATAPEAQGSGVAKQLLEPMLEQAKTKAWPVYLECSNQENLGFYRQFGFRLVDDLAITDGPIQGPTIWLMTLDV